MIKSIEIKNAVGGKLYFLDYKEYVSRYGLNTCAKQKEEIANNDNTFLRLFNNEQGFVALSPNNNNLQSGIDQNGGNFLNNYYSTRQLIWSFEVYGSNYPMIDNILFQDNQLVTIKITTWSNNDFIISGSLVGTYGGGTIEFVCPEPFFEHMQAQTNDCQTFLLNPEDLVLIPNDGFIVNKIYFTDTTKQEFDLFIDVNLFAYPIYELTGQFEDVKITNFATGTELMIKGLITEKLVIDTKERTVYLDGNDITSLVMGQYPDLVAGENKINFEFTRRFTDITACYSYFGRSASVF